MILGLINDLVDIAQRLMFTIFICKIPNHIPSRNRREIEREREREKFCFLFFFLSWLLFFFTSLFSSNQNNPTVFVFFIISSKKKEQSFRFNLISSSPLKLLFWSLLCSSKFWFFFVSFSPKMSFFCNSRVSIL